MSQRDEFDTAGTFVAMKDLLGELILFTPTEYVAEVVTIFSDKDNPKDAVITDLVVLSQEGTPEHLDVMILQGKLIGALKRKIPGNRKLLGVLSKGEPKKGMEAAYVLDAPDEAQQQMARDYLAGRTVAAATESADDDPFAVKK